MLESPLIDELVMEKYGDELTKLTAKIQETACETARSDILAVLEARFGDLPRDLREEIESIHDERQFRGLVRSAVSCPDLDAFRDAITRN